MSVLLLLVVASFILTIISAIGKCPLWIPVLLINIILLLQVLPKGGL